MSKELRELLERAERVIAAYRGKNSPVARDIRAVLAEESVKS